jgi:hypothetical protein
MVIFVKPNGATVVENDVIGLGSFVGKIAVVSPTRTGAYVTLHVAPANGEYLEPMYCAPMISTDVDDLGIYLCDMTRSISAVAGRVRYQVSFVYEDGREEFTPEGSFTVSQGVVSIPPDDPSESMYNAIRSALIANINNYTEIVEKLDMVWEAKTLVEENLEKINESKEAAEKAANHAQNISENFDVVANAALTSASQSASRAAESESAAKISETNANGYKNAAEAAQVAAEKARDEAEAAVGGDFVDKQIGIHNVNANAHNDIRQLIEGLAGRLNALANSDDTTLDQMAEVVAYIKSNRDLIAQITTNKVNVTDIVNDLVTNVSNKPLSAAQGVALKALIDAIKIPTTLPASDVYNWAKQPSKPSYSASEVGARPNTWTPSASEVGAGTFGGQVVANASGQAAGTSLLRNSRIVSADTNPTVNGEICWTYK